MIELTQEQIHALAKAGSSRVLNPQTQEMYVLMPLAEFGRLVEGEGYDDSPWTEEERDLLRAQACEMLDSFGKKP